MDAHKIFTSTVKGRNFFTEHVEAYYKIDDNSAIELSITTNTNYLSNDNVFKNMIGVTVVSNSEHDTNKSRCFQSMIEALKYIDSFNPVHKVIFERYNSYGDTRKKIINL